MKRVQYAITVLAAAVGAGQSAWADLPNGFLWNIRRDDGTVLNYQKQTSGGSWSWDAVNNSTPSGTANANGNGFTWNGGGGGGCGYAIGGDSSGEDSLDDSLVEYDPGHSASSGTSNRVVLKLIMRAFAVPFVDCQ